jgi:glycosyltransferase involved in cell wall biosynthesis
MNDVGTALVSVVVPVYQCSACLQELHRRLDISLRGAGVAYELVLVDDGSPDEGWETIRRLASVHPEVAGIQLSRNFGQHCAILAGLERSRGEWIVVMDCDLQDRPEEIPALLRKAREEGFDLVLARRHLRRDGILKRLGSRLFYWLIGNLTGSAQDAAIANFGLYHRRVIDAVCAMPEQHRYFPLLVRWVGFRAGVLDVAHDPRATGSSSYTLSKLVLLGLDASLSFSDKPMRIVAGAGALISAAAFAAAVYFFYRAALGKVAVVGWASIAISIWLLGGLIVLILGMLGLYIGKIFAEAKDRPKYLVRSAIAFGRGEIRSAEREDHPVSDGSERPRDAARRR